MLFCFQERYTMYYVKKYILPEVYWYGLVRCVHSQEDTNFVQVLYHQYD